jgi:hypothetical protein
MKTRTTPARRRTRTVKTRRAPNPVWFDRFYDLAMPWPEGMTSVETIAEAIRAAA